MKIAKSILISLAAFSVAAHAVPLPPKQVSIPFVNQNIFSDKHDGLLFSYDMNAQPSKKIVCQLSNVYKSWFVYKNHGRELESGVYGSSQTVTFTSKSKDCNGDEEHSFFQADKVGQMQIHDISYDNNQHAVASCHYEEDVSK